MLRNAQGTPYNLTTVIYTIIYGAYTNLIRTLHEPYTKKTPFYDILPLQKSIFLVNKTTIINLLRKTL